MTTRVAEQPAILFNQDENPRRLLPDFTPCYTTSYGSAYLSDSLKILRALPEASINAVITSPPYALHFKKEYGNVEKAEYVEWFLEFAKEIHRVLRADGSFILNIGGSYNKGSPTRSLYHYKLLIALVEQVSFHLAQECFWFNPAKMPVPAEWVTVRRIRIRDSVEYVWWLSKTEWPKANNRNVLKAYSRDMKRLSEKGIKRQKRPGGYQIRPSFSNVKAGGSIPPNVIEEPKSPILESLQTLADLEGIPGDMLKFGNNAANDSYTKRCKDAGIKPHPARYPAALPEFFIKLVTEPGDVVYDPFAGSNTTGAVAESLRRYWLASENVEEYLEASKFRFQL